MHLDVEALLNGAFMSASFSGSKTVYSLEPGTPAKGFSLSVPAHNTLPYRDHPAGLRLRTLDPLLHLLVNRLDGIHVELH
jgi:hypothetical protein